MRRGYLGLFGDQLQAGRSEDRISVRARFSTTFHTSPGVHPASYTRGRVILGGEMAGAWR